MKIHSNTARLCALLATLVLASCESPSPWVTTPPEAKIYTMLDIPMQALVEQPEKYIDTVFEDQFKFYHIYHSKEDADPAKRGQVILGKTHFTSRPIKQNMTVIKIQITPAQEAWMRAQHIERQDVVRARVRFAGIAPGNTLAFDLLEITHTPVHMRKK